jgi:hypothetical protein
MLAYTEVVDGTEQVLMVSPEQSAYFELHVQNVFCILRYWCRRGGRQGRGDQERPAAWSAPISSFLCDAIAPSVTYIHHPD